MDVCRNREQYPNAESDARVTVMRIDAPIYFANVEYIKDFIRNGHQKVRIQDSTHHVRLRNVMHITNGSASHCEVILKTTGISAPHKCNHYLQLYAEGVHAGTFLTDVSDSCLLNMLFDLMMCSKTALAWSVLAMPASSDQGPSAALMAEPLRAAGARSRR